MNIENIRLIGMDLDGTLLTDDKRLFPETTEKIKELSQRGIHFVPITGRPLSGIPSEIRGIEEIKYIITSNGSQIIENSTGRALFSFPLPNERVNEIIDILEGIDCMFEVFADGVGYVEQIVYNHYLEHFSGTPVGDYIFSSRRLTKSIMELFSLPDKTADEVFIICKNAETRSRLEGEIKEIEEIQHCNLGDRFLEITKKNTDKGEALSVLCDYLNIDLKNTIAFGDGENDLQFLERAGIAVAMENAFDSVKARADIITTTNNENGVLKILEMI